MAAGDARCRHDHFFSWLSRGVEGLAPNGHLLSSTLLALILGGEQVHAMTVFPGGSAEGDTEKKLSCVL